MLPFETLQLTKFYTCFHCGTTKLSSEIRLCGGCKIAGYCGKECQKANWKIHKPKCRGVITGRKPSSRDRFMKAVERLDRDPSFQEWIDAVVIKTLDLPDHPENIFKYGVKLLVRRQPALERTVHAGSREGVPEFVQLVKATRVDLENIHASTDWHTLDGMSRREQIDPVLLRVRISWELYDFAGAVLDTLKCFSPLHVEMVLPLIPKGPDAMEHLIMIFNELLRNNGTAEQKQRSQL